jgi:hypothetical protein
MKNFIADTKTKLEREGFTVWVVDTHSGAFDERLSDCVTLREGDVILMATDPDGRELDEYRRMLRSNRLTAEWQRDETRDGETVEVWEVLSW